MEQKQNKSLEKALDDFFLVAGNLILSIAIGVGFLIGGIQYGVEYLGCMDGTPSSKDTLTYHNGGIKKTKVSTFKNLYCEQIEGITPGYMIKLIFIYSVVGYVGTSAVYVAIKYKKYEKQEKEKNNI